MLDSMDEDAENGVFESPVDDDERYDFVRPLDCHAIVPSSGKQCTNSAGDDDSRLCGNHERARSLTRVDDVPAAPVADLRDQLVEQGDMNGVHAYRLATKFADAGDLWNAVVALEPIEIGDYTYDADGLASRAPEIAKLDDVDAGDHPLAEDRCIATTDSEKFDGRCTNDSYGASLLCGTHKNANDPDTIFDDVDFPTFVGHGKTIMVVELRDDFGVIVDTSDWSVSRTEREYVKNRINLVDEDDDADDWIGYRDEPTDQDGDDQDVDADQGDDLPDVVFARRCTSCDTVFDATGPSECPACDHVSTTIHGLVDHVPTVLEGVGEGDQLEITLTNTDRVFEGVVSDVGNGGIVDDNSGHVGVYIDDVDEVGGVLMLESDRDAAGEWDPVAAIDFDFDADDPDEKRLDMGTVDSVSIVDAGEEQDVEPRDNTSSVKDPDAEDDDMSKTSVDEKPPETADTGEQVDDDPDAEEVEADHDADEQGDDEYDPSERDGWVDPFIHDRRTDELEDVGLSGREAEVVACKEQGLTHEQIAEYLELPKSTVDEYSRRARSKVLDARALVDELAETYD